MRSIRRLYPFNAEQTVNILSEFGPLVCMFIVNAAYGINAGTWALLISTVVAMVVMRLVLGRLPVFPQIASGVTIVFGVMTLVTGDPMWVQIKVTIFNALFAIFLFIGLYTGKNFFKYVFDKTFHYTREGWDRFTFSFAWFFVFTAIMNEVVRQVFVDTEYYEVPLFGQMDGVNIWILFKIAFIMPLSGLYAWYLTRLMHKYRIDEAAAGSAGGAGAALSGPVAQVAVDRRPRGHSPLVLAALLGFIALGAGVAYAYHAMTMGRSEAAVSGEAKASTAR